MSTNISAYLSNLGTVFVWYVADRHNYPVIDPSPVKRTGGVSNINLDTFKKHTGCPQEQPFLCGKQRKKTAGIFHRTNLSASRAAPRFHFKKHL